MTRSGRSLLRQASVLLLLFCFGAAYAAPILAQVGGAPEPAPRRSQVPTPEPAPGARAQTSRPATTQVSTSPVPPPAAQNPVPPPVVLVQPTAPAPPAPAREERRQVRKRETAKEKPVRERTTKQATRRALPSLSRTEAGSTDTMLLIGGLALVVLVLLDTVFLTLSTRVLRSAG
jgi:outer membrane biosynthesis protein TonB